MSDTTEPRDNSDSDNRAIEMDRRQFLSATAVVGGGMALGFWFPRTVEAATPGVPVASQPWYRESLVPEVNAWITIAPDDTVTIRIGQTEIGTGVLTTNSMIVAEELQCDWKKVRVEHASANRDAREKAPEWTLEVPGKGHEDPAGFPNTETSTSTTGVYRRMTINASGNVRESRCYLQMAGAEARERLLLAAAHEWGVPVSELVARDSVITHARSKRRTTYGAIAARAATVQLLNPESIKLKTPDQFRLMGTEQKNFDVPLKVTGEAVYAIDVQLPGMLYAAAKSCPVWGGDVKSYDFNAIKDRPGVHSVVPFPMNALARKVDFLCGGVAVVADSWWHAKTALDALPIEWDYGPNANVDSATLLQQHLDQIKHEPGDVRMEWGDVDAGIRGAAKVFEATYAVPFSTRARMEPGNAVVHVGEGRVDIWTGDQNPQRILARASALTGMAPQDVYVHTTFLGGGFGNSGNGHQCEIAVVVANALKGRPVKLLITREEDLGTTSKYRAMGVCAFRIGLDGNGYPVAMDLHTNMASSSATWWRGLTAPPYFAPHYRFRSHVAKTHVPWGTRRGTGASPNAFYLETMIDELAHLAGKDPLLYRRELIARSPLRPNPSGFLQRDDWVRCLDLVAKMSQWGTALPQGWGRGVAIDDRRHPERDTITIAAEVATVEVTRRGQLRLHRMDVAFEEGYGIVNPLTVRKQIEGGIAWGYSDALHQATTIKDGRAVEVNLDTFPMSRMNEYPTEVNIQFFKTKRWITGVGEETVPQVAPAILNAVFKVTGKRFRSIPIKDQDLSWS
jgi:isoquinoline 1-oxidoreductase beta subunit